MPKEKVMDKHKEHLAIAGALASVIALGLIIYELRKNKAASSQAMALNPITEAIPIYTPANIGGSYAPAQTTSAHHIGRSNNKPVQPLSVLMSGWSNA